MNTMKSRRNKILLLLTILICLVAEPSRGSVLSDTANGMAPGTWAALQTNGLNSSFFNYPGGNGASSLQFFGSAAWDSVSRQVLFFGSGHFNAAMLHKYSESTNTWTRAFPVPVKSHAYYRNAVSASRRILGYLNPGVNIDLYNIDTGAFSETSLMQGSWQGEVGGAMIWFPERDRWYVVDGRIVSLREYNPNTNTWTTVEQRAACHAQPGQLQGSYYHEFIAYNPIRHEIVYGGGNTSLNASFSLCKMDANGTVTVLPVAPIPIGVQAANSNGGNVTIDPASGDLLSLTQHGQMYTFNFNTNQWGLLPNPPSMPAAMKQASNNIGGAVVVPIDTYGVVMYMSPSFELYLYKHAQGGTPVTSPPAVDAILGIGSLPSVDTTPPGAPTQLTLVRSGSSPPPPPPSSSTFAALCALSTTIFCQDFDVLPPTSQVDITEAVFHNSGPCDSLSGPNLCPEIDNGTLKLTVRSQSGYGSSGQYYVRFADFLTGGQNIGKGKEFFYQFKHKVSKEFLLTKYTGGGGWKLSMTGSKDESSCASNEIVVQNGSQRGFPSMYHACGYYEGFQVRSGAYDFDLQPGGPPINGVDICSYIAEQSTNQFADPPEFPPGCWGFAYNEWATFQIGITHGLAGQPSRIRLWAAHEGEPSVLVFDYSRVLRYEQGYGKIWLMNYHTGKDDAQVHPEGYVWYDQLIISRTQLPDR